MKWIGEIISSQFYSCHLWNVPGTLYEHLIQLCQRPWKVLLLSRLKHEKPWEIEKFVDLQPVTASTRMQAQADPVSKITSCAFLLSHFSISQHKDIPKIGSSLTLFLRNLWFNGFIFSSRGAKHWSWEQMYGPFRGFESLGDFRVEWEPVLVLFLISSHETCSLPHLTSVDLTIACKYSPQPV